MSHLSPGRLAAAGLALLSFALPSAAQASATCPEVDVVVVRGSTEGGPPFAPFTSQYALDGNGGYNTANSVFTRIKNELTAPTDGSTPIAAVDVRRTDIAYPADLPIPGMNERDGSWVADTPIFRDSAQHGTSELLAHLYGVVASCSNTRFVLLGFSQGALIVNNVLTNPRSQQKWIRDYTELPTLDDRVPSRIAAAAVFADIGRNIDNGFAVHASTPVSASAPGYLQGSKDDLNRGMNDGPASQAHSALFPRPVSHLAAYKGKIRSYCLTNDMVCTTNFGINILPHVQYGEANQPEHRRNLAIFAIQQLRNRVSKTFTPQCSFTSATNGAAISTTTSLKLRFEADVKDQATTGSWNRTNNVRATVSLTSAQAATLKSALGGTPTKVRRMILSLPYEARTTALPSNAQLYEDNGLVSYNNVEYPLSGGFEGSIPGGDAPTGEYGEWTIVTAGYSDLVLGQTFYLTFYGKESGMASVRCTLPTQDSEFGGRHFGRIAISN